MVGFALYGGDTSSELWAYAKLERYGSLPAFFDWRIIVACL